MKTYFVTDDGKTFNSKEAAEKYEADINKENDAVKAKRKEILDKVQSNMKLISDYQKKCDDLMEANEKLLGSYYELLTPDEKR